MTGSLNVLLSVLLPQGAHQGEAPNDFGQRALVSMRHPKIVEGRPPNRPTVVERLATTRRAKGRYIA